MFFLLRLAFWLGLVLVLLPTDKSHQSEGPHIDAVEALSAAGAAVSDMSQFCTRQPAACAVGGQAATVIGQRAQNGARKVYEFITEKRGDDHTSSIGTVIASTSQDTLSDADLTIEWRAPRPGSTPRDG